MRPDVVSVNRLASGWVWLIMRTKPATIPAQLPYGLPRTTVLWKGPQSTLIEVVKAPALRSALITEKIVPSTGGGVKLAVAAQAATAPRTRRLRRMRARRKDFLMATSCAPGMGVSASTGPDARSCRGGPMWPPCFGPVQDEHGRGRPRRAAPT